MPNHNFAFQRVFWLIICESFNHDTDKARYVYLYMDDLL